MTNRARPVPTARDLALAEMTPEQRVEVLALEADIRRSAAAMRAHPKSIQSLLDDGGFNSAGRALR